MPVAIVVTNDVIPAIYIEQNEGALLRKVNLHLGLPADTSKELMMSLLSGRPRPTGWYLSLKDAHAEISKTANPNRRAYLPLQPNDINRARVRLGLTRVNFGRALGINGNDNTVNKAVYEIETDMTKTLTREKQETLFALLAEYELLKGQNFDGHTYLSGGVDPDTGTYLGPEINVRTRRLR